MQNRGTMHGIHTSPALLQVCPLCSQYGFPVMAHSIPAKAHALIKKLPQGQKVAFFSTHGSLQGGQLSKQALEHAIGLSSKIKVLGHFGCRGKVSAKLMDSLKEQPEHKAWVEEALNADGHPDQHDLEDAKRFALQMLAFSAKK